MCEKLRRFLEKFTQLTKMLHDCRSQQISSLHLSYPQFSCSILGNFFVGKNASFEPQASIKLRAPFALRAPCVNIGNFIGFLSKSTRPRPQWPIWLIWDKNPNFWAWFSETCGPHTGLRFWVLSLRITGNKKNVHWGWALEDTWNFVQYSKIQGKSVV